MDDLRRSEGRNAILALAREMASACEIDERAPPRRQQLSDRWHGHLSRVVEAEIIPRLMLAHRMEASTRGPGPRKPTAEDIEAFASLVLAPAGEVVEARIAALVDDGLALDSLLLDLLAPTARHLGVLWEEDLCDFAELTIAMGRLQRIMHDLSRRYGGETGGHRDGHSILLSLCPGETHMFGLSMIEQFFRDAGWDVTSTALAPVGEILNQARTAWFDVIGLSLGCEVLLPTLTKTVLELRRVSFNPGVRILVGGPIFVDNPGHIERVGADATASDARRAVAAAEFMLDMKAGAC